MSANTCYERFNSPVGGLFIVFTKDALSEIIFEQEYITPAYPHRRSPAAVSFISQLNDYFRGRLKEFRQKISFLSGTDFEQSVWLALRDIPYGETRSYKWLAEKIGKPSAFRAVGHALGKNPIPIVLPCHRVIESDGSLGGYSGGIDIKRRLLDMEYYFGPFQTLTREKR